MNVSEIATFILGIDDFNMFIHYENTDTLANRAYNELSKLYVWFKANRLLMNARNNIFILFCSKINLFCIS